MSDGVKYSEHILVDFEKTNLSFPCLRFIKLHQTSAIVGCQQSCRVFRKTAPLTTFHQVDIVYMYIGQHNILLLFTFPPKRPSPTFCKHASFSEEVARRILNSEFLTVRFLFRKDRERRVLWVFENRRNLRRREILSYVWTRSHSLQFCTALIFHLN